MKNIKTKLRNFCAKVFWLLSIVVMSYGFLFVLAMGGLAWALVANTIYSFGLIDMLPIWAFGLIFGLGITSAIYLSAKLVYWTLEHTPTGWIK